MKDEMVYAIRTELKDRKDYLIEKKIDSIYFGGGTPSLLDQKDLENIFEEISKHFVFDVGAEITLEANPDDIHEDKLHAWKQIGINRLSIGLQSFDDEELHWFGRTHHSLQGIESVKLAQDAGFGNISVDLIYGSKFQNKKKWAETLDQIIALNVQHVSAYNLTIENKTELGIKNKRGLESGVDEKLSSHLFEILSERLTHNGFEHYEISNFAKEGFISFHNSRYWLGAHYLGIGPSAHSYNGQSRQWNVKSNARYISQLKRGGVFYEREELTVKEKYNEYILTRLRTKWGCDENEMKKLFPEKYLTHFKKNISRFANFTQVNDDGVYTLNLQGKLRADRIASELFFG